MSDCFLGEVRMFAGNYNPENWIICNGQTLNVQQYQALFSLMGTIYGGDGVTTFKAPDLQSRIPIGQGTNTTTNPPLSSRVLGQTGGEENHTLVYAEMPAHTHSFVTSTATATGQNPTGMVYGQVVPTATNYGLYTTVTTPLIQFDAKAVTYAGGGQAHANVMITTAINFIMALQGNYPTRRN